MNGKMGRLRALKEAASTSRRKFRPVIASGAKQSRSREAQRQYLDRHGTFRASR